MGTTTDNGVNDFASDPNSFNGIGAFSITAGQSDGSGVVNNPSPNGTSLLEQTMNIMGKLMGVSPAFGQTRACALYNSSYQECGYINFSAVFSFTPGMNLALFLIENGGGIDSRGSISGPGIMGYIFNFEGMPNAALGIMMFNAIVTATNLDDPTLQMTATQDGQQFPMSFLPGHVWGQATALQGPTGNVPIRWPAQRVWNTTGPNNSIGIPLMNGTQTQLAFAKQNSFLLPDFVGGPVNPATGCGTIWSMRTGRCVVPWTGYSGPGFALGSAANYQMGLVLIWANAQGCILITSGTTEPINVIDPYTGKLFVPTSYLWAKVWNGSQQFNLLPSEAPQWAYTGPAPSAAAPGYGSGITSIIGASNGIQNNAIWNLAQLAQYNGAPGVPEGPDHEEDC